MTLNDALIFIVPPVTVLTIIILLFMWGVYGNTEEQ